MGWRQIEFPLLVITSSGGFTGLFVYGPGPPAKNNLLFSVAAGQGTDPFGNPFFSGACAYFGAAGSAQVAQMFGQSFQLFSELFPALNKGGMSGPSIFGGGGANPQTTINFFSGRISTDTPTNLIMYSGTPGLLGGNPSVTISAGIPSLSPITTLLFEVRGSGMAASPAAATNLAYVTLQAGDTANRWQVDGNGLMSWGPGNAAVDTTFFRQGAANLQTPGSLTAGASLNCFGSVGIFKNNDTNIALFIQTLFDANNRFQIDDQGKHSWGPGGATAVDTDLFRSAAGTLRTDNSMEIGNTLNIPANAGDHFGVSNAGLLFLIAGTLGTTLRAVAQVVGDTQNRWQIDANGKQSWGPGGGTAPDTSLSRLQTGILTTPGEFDASILVATTELALVNQGSAPGADPNHTLMVGSNADLMFTVGGKGTSGFVPAANSDPTLYTVTTATLGQFAKVWSQPAGSLTAGATMELKAFGHGKQGTTQQAPTISFMLNGGVLFTAVLPAAFANISANFGFDIEAEIMIFTAGAAGTMWVEMKFTASGSIAVGAILVAQAIDTTVVNTFSFDANWGAVVGAPTITSNGNYFVKVA